MDNSATPTISGRIADYALALRFEDIPSPVIEKCKELMLDSIGCAIVGSRSEPAHIVKDVLFDIGGVGECTVIGDGRRLPASSATLLNGVMVRYLDCNDTYQGKRTVGHPSEILPTVWAMSERQGVSGRTLLTAAVVGYEIQACLNDSINPWWEGVERAWIGLHQVTFGAFASPAVAGMLLGLSRNQLINAIGLTASTNLVQPSWCRGTGDMPMIKAIGYASTAEAGVKAALLARRGFTAPGDAMDNFFEVFGRMSSMEPMHHLGETFRMPRVMIKSYAAQALTQTSIEAAAELSRDPAFDRAALREVIVRVASREMKLISQPEAYEPTTREAADHSLPYTVAMALCEGTVMPSQFEGQWNDPDIQRMMKLIRIETDTNLCSSSDDLFPLAAEVELVMASGARLVRRVDKPKGHHLNPMSRQDLERKFSELSSPYISRSKQEQIIDLVFGLDVLDEAGNLVKALSFQ